MKLLTVALLLTGFLGLEAQTNRPIQLQCPGGETFTATFRGGRNGRVTVDMVGKPRLTLRQVEAASGSKYSDGYTVLWEKGGEVLIESGTINAQGCTERGRPIARSMTGTFTYLADAATFTECNTGTRYPVAMEGRYIDLERDYTSRQLHGAPLLVTIEGSIQSRPPMEGPSPVPTVIVSRFISARQGDSCTGAETTLSGEWILTELNGNALNTPRPPTMTFLDEDSRIAGFAGCNRFTSAVEQNGRQIRFRGGAATRMACPGPALSLESEFLSSLETVVSFEASGSELMLMDAAGGARLKLRKH